MSMILKVLINLAPLASIGTSIFNNMILKDSGNQLYQTSM